MPNALTLVVGATQTAGENVTLFSDSDKNRSASSRTSFGGKV